MRIYPTLNQLILATLAYIKSHPLIVNPPVTHPTTGQPVKIERYRSYDGLELVEPGLTLGLFPIYSNKNFTNAYSRREPMSVVFSETDQMGTKLGNDTWQMVEYRFALGLYYQGVAIGQTQTSTYYGASIKSSDSLYGRTENVLSVNREQVRQVSNEWISSGGITLDINPAEMILRDYLELVRYVVEGCDHALTPFSIRSTKVVGYDFPTTSWNKDSKNIYLHYAYLFWKVRLTAPVRYSNPQEIQDTFSSIQILS